MKTPDWCKTDREFAAYNLGKLEIYETLGWENPDTLGITSNAKLKCLEVLEQEEDLRDIVCCGGTCGCGS